MCTYLCVGWHAWVRMTGIIQGRCWSLAWIPTRLVEARWPLPAKVCGPSGPREEECPNKPADYTFARARVKHALAESLHVGEQPHSCMNLDTSSLPRDGGWASILIGVSLLFHFSFLSAQVASWALVILWKSANAVSQLKCARAVPPHLAHVRQSCRPACQE